MKLQKGHWSKIEIILVSHAHKIVSDASYKNKIKLYFTAKSINSKTQKQIHIKWTEFSSLIFLLLRWTSFDSDIIDYIVSQVSLYNNELHE